MWEPLKLSYHSAKFYSHRDCGSGDLMVLVCHMISLNHGIKESCDFMGRSSSRRVIILQKFGVNRHCGKRDIMVSVCYVISQDHLIEASCDYMGRSYSR